MASEIWVADTPSLTPYKPRCESVSSGFLSQSQSQSSSQLPDSISETDSVKTPKGVDLMGHLEQAMNGVGVGSEGTDSAGIAFNREMSSTSDATTYFERECRTPRDHSQVMPESKP